MIELEKVLKYKNEDVVHRFAEDFGVSETDSQEIFQETLKWLWLCALQIEGAQQQGIPVVEIPLLSEANIIDLMWHTFILFTSDYAHFCESHFSTFIHHMPQTHLEKKQWQKKRAENPEAAVAERQALVYAAYGLIYDTLGPQTLCKWVEEFPSRFNSISG